MNVMKKDRGLFLTIMLILAFFWALVSILVPSDPDRMQQSAGLGKWYPPFVYFNSFSNLFIVWGIWTWKKLAVYLNFISLIVGSWISFLVVRNISPDSYLIPTIFGTILSVGLWFWVIYRKWKYFE